MSAEFKSQNGTLRVLICGEIDHHTARELCESIDLRIASAKPQVVLLDFSRVDVYKRQVYIDLGFGNTDIDAIKRLCDDTKVELCIKRTEIGKIIFEHRREKNPCALCAKMRRGAIHNAALEMGSHKIALGHHMDDAVETFMMNLMYESRIGCFQPVTYLSRKDVTVIRPMIYMNEREIKGAVKRLNIPVMKSPCPVDGTTKRENTKQLLKELSREHPHIRQSIFGAMQRAGIDGWGIEN